MAASYYNDFEGGSDGTAVTAANSGGASGDAFDAASVGTGSTLAYSAVRAWRGLLSLLISGGSAVSTFLSKTFAAATANATVRAVFYLTANPAANLPILGFYSGSTVRVRISISTTGKIAIGSPSGGSLVSTNSIPLNQWFMIEFKASTLGTTTGTSLIKIYTNPDDATPLETFGQTNVNYGGTADRCRVGVGTNASGAIPSFWIDNVSINDTGADFGPFPKASSGRFFAML